MVDLYICMIISCLFGFIFYFIFYLFISERVRGFLRSASGR